MVMTISIVMQWRAIRTLMAGLLAPGIVIGVMHGLKITRHCPDMLNRHMNDQEQESNRSHKRNSFHESPTITFPETKGQSHTVGTNQRSMGEIR